jgi:hypothetical protein
MKSWSGQIVAPVPIDASVAETFPPKRLTSEPIPQSLQTFAKRTPFGAVPPEPFKSPFYPFVR